MARALFAALFVLCFGIRGIQAQDRSLEYQLAAENHITFYANIWDCKTPNAESALADTQREIQQVQSLMDSLTTRVGFVTIKLKPEQLEGGDKAQYDAYSAILQRLQNIAAGLGKLPPCQEPMKRTGMNYKWSGFYAGIGGGGFWQGGNWTTTDVISLGGRDPLVDAVKSLYKVDPFLGLYFGYMFNMAEFFSGDYTDNWLFGFELDVDYMDAAVDPGIPGTGGLPGNKSSDSVTVRSKWDMAVRPRLAYMATPSTQLFVAGGPAWMHEQATVNCTGPGVCGTNGIPAFSQTNSSTRLGWTAGGGVEQQIWGPLHGRLEYRYSDYGTWSTSFGAPANLYVATNVKLHTQALMAGVTYQFGGF